MVVDNAGTGIYSQNSNSLVNFKRNHHLKKLLREIGYCKHLLF